MKQSIVYTTVALTVVILLLGALLVPVVDAMDEKTVTEKVSDYVYSNQSRPSVQLDGRTDDITYTWTADDDNTSNPHVYVNGAEWPNDGRYWSSYWSIYVLTDTFVATLVFGENSALNGRLDIFRDNIFANFYQYSNPNGTMTLKSGTMTLTNSSGATIRTVEYSTGYACVPTGYTMIFYPTNVSVPVDVGSPVAIFHEEFFGQSAEHRDSANFLLATAAKDGATWETITAEHWDTDTSTYTVVTPTVPSDAFRSVDGQNYVNWKGNVRSTFTSTDGNDYSVGMTLIAPLTYHEVTTTDSAIKSLLTAIPLVFVAVVAVVAARFALRDD